VALDAPPVGAWCAYSGVGCTSSGAWCAYGGIGCTSSGNQCTYVGILCAYISIGCACSGIPCCTRPMIAHNASTCMRDLIFASTSGSVRGHTMTALISSTNGTAIFLIQIFCVRFHFILIMMNRKIILQSCPILHCFLGCCDMLDTSKL